MKPEDLLAYLDGELSPEEERTIECELERNHELRLAFLAECWQRLLLADVHRPGRLRVLSPSMRTGEARTWKMWVGAGIAAVLAIAICIGWSVRRDGASRVRLIAGDVTGAAWQIRGETRQSLGAGDTVLPGDNVIIAAGGHAKLRFLPEGTTIDLAGQSELFVASIAGGKRLELKRGALSAEVAPQRAGEPMRILTPQAQAEVLGTRFDLSSDPAATRLRVELGRVLIVGRSDDEAGVVVAAPHGALVGEGRQVDVIAWPPRESIHRGLLFSCAFDEGSGLVAADRSASGLHAQIAISPGGAAGWTRGWSGTALEFQQAGARVSTPMIALPRQFTISLWARLRTDAAGLQPLVANSASGVSTDGFRFFANVETGRLIFETGGTSGLGSQACTKAGVLRRGDWHHLAVAADATAGSVAFYVDGVDVTERPGIRSDFTRTQPLHLGRMATDYLRRFGGAIDEVRIHGRALSPAEVDELAHQAPVPAQP